MLKGEYGANGEPIIPGIIMPGRGGAPPIIPIGGPIIPIGDPIIPIGDPIIPMDGCGANGFPPLPRIEACGENGLLVPIIPAGLKGIVGKGSGLWPTGDIIEAPAPPAPPNCCWLALHLSKEAKFSGVIGRPPPPLSLSLDEGRRILLPPPASGGDGVGAPRRGGVCTEVGCTCRCCERLCGGTDVGGLGCGGA